MHSAFWSIGVLSTAASGRVGIERPFRQAGDEFIPVELVGFDSETDGVPAPDRYHLWEPTALEELLSRTRPYLKQVQEACRDLLDDLGQRYPDDV